MSRNIGFTKKKAEVIAHSCTDDFTEAYVQKEEHCKHGVYHFGKECTHEYIVVLRKRRGK
jgi:hypothetical protein